MNEEDLDKTSTSNNLLIQKTEGPDDPIKFNQLPENIKKNHWAKRFKNEITAYAAIASVLVTAALAIITYCSLQEIQNQRNTAQSQFILLNKPSVFINVLIPDFSKKVTQIRWNIRNFGGTVYNLKAKCIVLLANKGPQFYVFKTLMKNHFATKLDKGLIIEVFSIFEDKAGIDLLSDALKNSNVQMIVYFRVDYEIPPEFSLTRKKESEIYERSSIWNNQINGFLDTNEELHRNVTAYISKNSLLISVHP